MNQGDTFDALYELADGIVSKYSAGVAKMDSVKAWRCSACSQIFYKKKAADRHWEACPKRRYSAGVSPTHGKSSEEGHEGLTAHKSVEYPPNALPTLGTCDHIDIWGETGENGIACKSPAIKQCEGCGESMCKAHLVDNLCWECAVKI